MSTTANQTKLPHPFYSSREYGQGQHMHMIIEQLMCEHSASLREKPEYGRKLKDLVIRAHWKEEIMQHLTDSGQPVLLDVEAAAEYILKELADYATLRDEATGIDVSCSDGIWQSDYLISDNLKHALQIGVQVLEDVPDAQKDWHPRSNGLVLDLVHPSLYPMVYGHTIVNPPGSTRQEVVRHLLLHEYSFQWPALLGILDDAHYLDLDTDPTVPRHNDRATKDILARWKRLTQEDDRPDDVWIPEVITLLSTYRPRFTPSRAFWDNLLQADTWSGPRPAITPAHCQMTSNKFAWLPTDFDVSEDGPATAKNYINNLHPSQTELYQTIDRVVGAFVPMFERVLSDLVHPVDLRIGEYDRINEPTESDCEGDDDYNDRYDEWFRSASNIKVEIPEYAGQLAGRSVRYSLRNREIQIVVKLANIILNPENNSYPGGSWHIEGMMNERIAASGIYYYEEENITESKLAFRTAVAEPPYEQSDYTGCNALWGLDNNESLVQNRGAVKTIAGRAIAFPNVFQHCVSPFELVDKSKSGHRKILALFLIDPAVHVFSTSDVPMQQREWFLEALVKAIGTNPQECHLAKLPRELLEMIVANCGHFMTREQAFRVREELMDERTQFVKTNDEEYFSASFNMCEH